MVRIRFGVLGAIAAAFVVLGGWSGAGNTIADGYVPPATPPAEYQATFDELSQTLTTFESQLDASWDGSVGDGRFAGALSVANGNKSAGLLSPSTWTNVLSMLDAYQAMGVKLIKLDVQYPVFTPAFHTYLAAHPPPAIPGYTYSVPNFIGTPNSFYNKLAAEIRSRGLGLWIEYGTLFADYSPTPPGAYFADMRTAGLAATQARYTSERSAESALIVSQLKPDYFSILEEPDTQAMNFGYFPGQVPIFGDAASWRGFVQSAAAAIAAAAPTGPTLLGAGIGVWDSETYIPELAGLPALDYIDLHIYPLRSLTTNYLQKTLDYIDEVHSLAPGKFVTIGEAWTYKTSAAEVSAGIDFNTVFGRDVYSFWEPVDRQFLDVLFKLMHYKRVAAIMPYWATYYFKQLTYGDPSLNGLTPIQLIGLAGQQSLANIASVTLTGTGEKFEELVATPPDADGDGVPDSADSSDTDADGVPDNADACPLYRTTWPVPAGDTDCDGFPDSVPAGGKTTEANIGTTPLQHCAVTPTANDEPTPDSMPPDFNDDPVINGQDTGKFGGPFGSFNHTVAQGPFGGIPGARFDFNGDGAINGADTGKYQAYFNKVCA
jgi:hypothetical protein